jgi:hypothetical protein
MPSTTGRWDAQTRSIPAYRPTDLRGGGEHGMKKLVGTLKYARYAMGSMTAVLFAACGGGS